MDWKGGSSVAHKVVKKQIEKEAEKAKKYYDRKSPPSLKSAEDSYPLTYSTLPTLDILPTLDNLLPITYPPDTLPTLDSLPPDTLPPDTLPSSGYLPLPPKRT